MRLGAILLVFATFAAVVFGVINFQQRMAFEVPDDGASWVGQSQGVQAAYIAPNAAADRAGIKTGDRLVAINGVPVQRAADVTKRLWALGVMVAGALHIRARRPRVCGAGGRCAGSETAGA